MPLTELHVVPQPPQLEVFVAMFVSHPFATLPSQLAQPDEHASWHAPETHEGVAFTVLHALPHEPQFEVVVVGVSQPFEGLASQLAKPELHRMPHVPEEQVGVPFVELQVLPHEPQLAVSLPSTISQPSVTLPLQLAKPGVHAMLQLPEGQLGVPFAELHVVPQAPQLATV